MMQHAKPGLNRKIGCMTETIVNKKTSQSKHLIRCFE